MVMTTSQMFDSLDSNQTFLIRKYQFSLPAFGVLRRNLRKILMQLRETDDIESIDISERLQSNLSEWLTVPIPFDETFLGSVHLLGDVSRVEARWGKDTRVLIAEAQAAAWSLLGTENPLRECLQTVIGDLQGHQRVFKIFCHRNALSHFQSLKLPLPESSPCNSLFIHSLSEYQNSDPFDVLIKVGPLRSRGWGSVPDAFLSAPKFPLLIQVLWPGCIDEAGVGFDPVNTLNEREGLRSSGITWLTEVISTEVGLPIGHAALPMEDELQIFREMGRALASRTKTEKSLASRVQIDDDNCVFYHPHSEIPCFDPSPQAPQPFGLRSPGETLREGMYTIRAILRQEVDLGDLKAEDGYFTKIWKAELNQACKIDQQDVCEQLRIRGVDLVYLESAIEKWCAPPTTVIRSPQQIKHFRILIEVLGLNSSTDPYFRGRRKEWWEYAWEEIRRSRGEAIREGALQQEIIRDQVLNILSDMLQPIRQQTVESDEFAVEIPPERGLKVAVFFNKVYSVEQGYRIPESMFERLLERHRTEQWLS